MKRLLLIALSAGFLAQPAVTAAQLAPVPSDMEYLQWVGKGDAVVATWGGVYLGPYLARFAQPTTASFSIYCVDYLHHAGSQTVNATSLASGQTDADMGNTRLGSGAGSYATYQKAAYLSSLFASWSDYGSDQRTVWSGLHAAIWEITTPTQTLALGSGSTATLRDSFITMADQNAGSFGNGWYVLSGAAGYDGQEFLIQTGTSVPEPGALLLIGSGLLMLLVVTWRRKVMLPEA